MPCPHTATATRAALALLPGLGSACSMREEGDVRSKVELLGHNASALAASTITTLVGTYGADCAGRSTAGTDPWTLAVEGAAGADELSVRKSDSDCVLTITEILTGGAMFVAS